jgi:hypothetical protein
MRIPHNSVFTRTKSKYPPAGKNRKLGSVSHKKFMAANKKGGIHPAF